MSEIHLLLGWIVLIAAAAVALAGALAKLSRRVPGRTFEVASLVVFALIVLQVLVGLVVLALGRRPHDIHFLYGALIPLAMAGGIGIARGLERDRWVVISWACVLVALLTMRAIMTGSR